MMYHSHFQGHISSTLLMEGRGEIIFFIIYSDLYQEFAWIIQQATCAVNLSN